MPAALTDKQYRKKLRAKFPYIECTGKYTTYNTYTPHMCHKCGREWKGTPDTILRSAHGCQRCGMRRGRTMDDYRKEFKQRRPDIRILSKDYSDKGMKFKHDCGHVWTARPKTTLNSDACPRCSGKGQKTHAHYVADLKKVWPDITVVGTYVKSAKPILHRHKCGHEWKVRPNSLMKGTSGCPRCGMKMKVVKIKGRTMALRGYEPMAARLLVKEGYDVSDLCIDSENKTPRIRYKFKDRMCIYRPDFYVKREKLLIEVKSKATLGLEPYPFRHGLSSSDLFNKMRAKARRCQKKGYDFRLMVLDKDGSEVQLPDNWLVLSRQELLDLVG